MSYLALTTEETKGPPTTNFYSLFHSFIDLDKDGCEHELQITDNKEEFSRPRLIVSPKYKDMLSIDLIELLAWIVANRSNWLAKAIEEALDNQSSEHPWRGY